ncbi:hypothetical protein BGZ99_006065 [Dissophora globulifera]|uniref:C2 domain-containing protein n=1 Tax=Dissophora globulifera TaxID=979702 RepID=A0A9P6USI6_9FUNG|nr:hypothetical protein BGZ99_006065 [Dissophora globulifera]
MHSLQVSVLRANQLDDVETVGKNDPYCRVSLVNDDKTKFQKTAVKKDAGKNVEWNQTLTLEDFQPTQHHLLYVDILDDDLMSDAPIGFAAIPLSQVEHATGRAMKGTFNLFTPGGKQKGTVSLFLAILSAGQGNVQVPDVSEMQGLSEIDNDHQHRIKSMKRKEQATDAAMAAGVIGGLLGAKALFDGHKTAAKKEV